MIIHPLDTVEVRDDGHKYALRDIAAGENVIKYGMPIGHATCAIRKGEHVHVHNVATNLGDALAYRYEPDFSDLERREPPTIRAFRHADCAHRERILIVIIHFPGVGEAFSG